MSVATELYRAEQYPVFQNRMFDSATEAIECEKGDILLTQNPVTGLISNALFRPELLTYDENYQNEQAVSERFQTHLDDVVSLIANNFESRNVIEVGCGKGFFLNKLRKAGFTATGLDPTYEGKDDGVVKEFYGPKLGLIADGIVLRHVLEHIKDPFSFLQLIRESNGGSGRIYMKFLVLIGSAIVEPGSTSFTSTLITFASMTSIRCLERFTPLGVFLGGNIYTLLLTLPRCESRK